ncbi:MAG: hypothetical protein CFE24_10550 [Flavobacterium sp. BFFFF2]|nr:MAG: hypothetical protein CFE24_10550 [Flavobacterium sp. BFFFF2]
MKKLIFLFVFYCFLFPAASAQNNWDGDSAVGKFSFCNNWFGDNCPDGSNWTSSIDLRFVYRNNPSQSSMFLDFGHWKNVRSIFFQDTFNYATIIDADGNGMNFWFKIENYSYFGQTINFQLSAKGLVAELNPINGDLTFSSNIYNDGNINYNVYGANNKKVTFTSNCKLYGSSSANFYLLDSSIVVMGIANNTNNYRGITYVQKGELWLDSTVSLNSSSIQLGNGDSNINKVYISHASTATSVSTPITVVGNSSNATIGGINTSNTHTFTGNINLNNNTVNFDEVSAGGSLVCNGAITGSGSIRKIGPGLIRFGSTSNNYTGATQISAGTLQLGASQVIPNTSAIVLNGGTLSSGLSTGFSETGSTLQLTANSTIALGTGNHTLQFAASNSTTWTSSRILTITGWNGSCEGRIYIGTDSTGLTSTQLSQITFQGYSAGAQITSSGEIIPVNLGTMSSNQIVCKNSGISDITISNYSGSVSKWQMASNATFTTGVTDIANTSASLTSAQIGTLTATRYFRAVLITGSCGTTYSNVVSVTINATTYASGSWNNGNPSSSLMAVYSSNATISADVTACSCQITGTAVVSVNAGINVTVAGEVTVATGASFTFANSASLIQTDASATNSGSINYYRNTPSLANNYDFVYWGSPVGSATLGSFWMTSGASTFYSFNASINDWSIATSGTTMTPGIGYISRALNGNGGWSPGNSWSALYSGTPNNGNISTAIYRGGSNYNNLISNPYPSALDLEQFYQDNNAVITPNFYFWTHNTAITVSGYTANDYAAYNALLGAGVGTGSTAVTGGAAPDRYVDAAQGFFCEGFNSGGTATFSNSQRVSGSNNAFYRFNASNRGIEKHRIWLNLTNSGGFYKQLLLAFAQGGTDEYDDLLDARSMDSNPHGDFYSVIPNNRCVIQSVNVPFNASKTFNLGCKVNQAGTYRIALDHFDNLFQTENIWLEDVETGHFTDLKRNAYTFTAAAGDFSNRFILRFQNPLSVQPTQGQTTTVYFSHQAGTDYLNASLPMKQVRVFNMNGAVVQEVTANGALQLAMDQHLASGFYMAEIQFENEVVQRKKWIRP